MNEQHALDINRRHFFGRSATGLGTMALASLLAKDGAANEKKAAAKNTANAPGISGFPDAKPTAKRVIYLFQSGAPSQIDLFDEKPKLRNLRATEYHKGPSVH